MKNHRSFLVMLLTLSGLAASTCANPVPPQRGDISLAESKRISPYPPKTVKVAFTDGSAVIQWTKVPSEKITGYEIYRIVGDGKLEKVGHTSELKFVDKSPPKGKVSYAVASVDYNDNRSKPRQAITDSSE
jgi:hypothetical protein